MRPPFSSAEHFRLAGLASRYGPLIPTGPDPQELQNFPGQTPVPFVDPNAPLTEQEVHPRA